MCIRDSVKTRSDGVPLVGLEMNRTQCRSTSDDFLVDPILVKASPPTEAFSGFLVGATIHDVAQVVGAGYSISDEAGDIATYVKILRVALLPVVMLVAMLSFRGAQTQRVAVPWFLVMFVLCAVIANLGILPGAVLALLSEVSRWFLVVAISALGVKTSLARIAKVQFSYVLRAAAVIHYYLFVVRVCVHHGDSFDFVLVLYVFVF